MSPTLPGFLQRNAEKYGDTKVALREKEFGVWQSVSWKAYWENVKHLALGLLELGYQPGDKLSVIGDNRPEWVYSELAIQSLNGAVVGIFPDSHLEQVQYIIDHSDTAFVMVEDQEQADKILQIKDQIPKVKRVIVDDLKGMRSYDDPLLIPFKEVQAMGRKADRRDPKLFPSIIEKLTEDDVAAVLYTSGTTGLPKGAMLTHANLVKMITAHDSVDPAYETDNHVSFLPLPWVGEQVSGVAWNLYKAITINFPEKVETVRQDMREIGPNVIIGPPRLWETMSSEVQVKIQDSGWIKRRVYDLFMPVGYHLADLRLKKQKPGPLWKILDKISYYLFFRSLTNYLGLTKLRNVYTGGAPLGQEIQKFFMAMGINIKQVYGQTESTGISVGHRNDDIRLDTVGVPIPGVEISLSDASEILIKGSVVFKGYYKNEEATAKAVFDGWLHTGDEGLINEDGHLIMIDRQADVMFMADKTKFSPQLIENKLKFSPYIRDVMILGEEKDYIAAMVTMDMANVGKWAENHRLAYTTYTDLSQKKEVYELIAEEIVRINASLPKAIRIKRFVMLYKE
ncbi:MAG: AMP-binding protein, partial [Thermodesulfobacteriota bacterium]|nr:AMP-binding protein [Thermodesulfobacteriota bacterium]